MRSHGEGSLFQRKTGRGRGRWVAVVTQRDGRRASRTAKTREEAKAALAELLRLRDARAPVTRNIRLSDYLERWANEPHGWSPSTARKHRTIVDCHLVPALGLTRLSELSVADVERAIAGRPVGAQSQSHIRATLRRALQDALRDGLVQRNVGGLARPVKLPHRERTILDANQARILIESTKGTTYGPLWTLLVTTGLRISEALGLSWSDVELGGNDGQARTTDDVLRHGAGGRGAMVQGHGPSLTVRRQLARENGEWVHRPPKTAKGRRTIPLTPLGVEALRAQRTQQREWISEWFGHSPRAYYGGSDGAQRSRTRVARNDGAVGVGTEGDDDRHGVRGLRPAPSRAPVQPIDGLVFTTSRGRPLHETNTLAALTYDLRREASASYAG